MQTGTIVTVRDDKGYGFIRPIGQDDDVFFHASDLIDGLEFDATLQERRVEFETFDSGRGLRAKNVRSAG